MKKKKLLIIVLTFMSFINVEAQKLVEGQKLWSADNKLTIKDFKVNNSDNYNEVVYSQFIISHSVRSFDFLKRNLNKKVLNIFAGNASWIDTVKVSKDRDLYIDFQQLQFDLAETEARKFRKKLFISKNKIAKGFSIVSEISNQIISDFTQRRLKLVKETEGGRNKEQLKKWKNDIEKELKDLHQFRFENKKRIKLK